MPRMPAARGATTTIAAALLRRVVTPVPRRSSRCYSRGSALASANAAGGERRGRQRQRPRPRPPNTDGGTVEATFVFHRHGDRAPNRYLGAPAHLDAESDHWRSRIPDRGRHDDRGGGGDGDKDPLSIFFPPEVHPSQNGGVHLDVGREPFGFLTYRGMDQMREAGMGFRRRYERFGHRRRHGSKGGDEGTTGGGDGRYSLLEHWDVRAYSTNYLRTVTSVQCFLDGLVGSGSNGDFVAASSGGVDDAGRDDGILYAGGGLGRYYRDAGRIERMAHDAVASTLAGPGDLACAPDDGVVRVRVRDRESDTLNAFDKHPDMMEALVRDVIATERFQRIDGAARDLAEDLSAQLPGLRGAPQAFGGTPSGINWIHANDHFVCRRAHSVPLLAFSDREGTPGERDAEARLASLATPVCSHLAWRFREWYRCPRLLAAVACPPFREVLGIMKGVAAAAAAATAPSSGQRGDDDDDRRPFVLYSCHDVTLLALLYAIGADFLVSGEDCGGAGMREGEVGAGAAAFISGGSVRDGTRQASWRWWPTYSSTIAFELVRPDDNDGDDDAPSSAVAGIEGGGGYFIRVILNGDAVRLMPRMSVHDEGFLKEGQSLSTRRVFGEMGEDPTSHTMMRLSDFEQVIRVLEEAGGGDDFLRSFSSSRKDNARLETTEIDKIGVDGG